jgi:hypothetical protein
MTTNQKALADLERSLALPARKVRLLRDVRVVLDHSRIVYYWQSLEEQAKVLESWARELRDFLRDHRSQDPVQINVERDYADVCSVCKRPWETYQEEGKTLCAQCGVECAEGEK